MTMSLFCNNLDRTQNPLLLIGKVNMKSNKRSSIFAETDVLVETDPKKKDPSSVSLP